jgi:hypothetical protein
MNNYSAIILEADGPNGLVIVANILPMRRFLLLSRWVLVGKPSLTGLRHGCP